MREIWREEGCRKRETKRGEVGSNGKGSWEGRKGDRREQGGRLEGGLRWRDTTKQTGSGRDRYGKNVVTAIREHRLGPALSICAMADACGRLARTGA